VGDQRTAVATLLSLPAVLLVHKLLHKLLHMRVHPGAGPRRDSMHGRHAGAGMLLALYLGETSRGRLGAMLVTPRVAITMPPWALCLVSAQFSGDWAALSLLDGLASIGDVMGVWLLLRGAPAGAIVRNQGWQTWWRARGD
jgi:hypothetical protein